MGCVREETELVIKQLDMLEEDKGLSLEERGAREVALSKLWDLERVEDISWRQKPRVN